MGGLKLEQRRKIHKWKDLPLMVAETNILKYSAAMNIGYTQSSKKYYHVLKIRPVLV